MIFSVTNPTDFVDWSKTIHKMWSCSFWTLPHRGLSLKDQPPRNTPDSFCRRFTRQNHRCAAWAVFFFFTNKILCSCSIFQNLFSVVDCTTSKCYPCAWKKQNVVSALRPAFFILYLESFIRAFQSCSSNRWKNPRNAQERRSQSWGSCFTLRYAPRLCWTYRARNAESHAIDIGTYQQWFRHSRRGVVQRYWCSCGYGDCCYPALGTGRERSDPRTDAASPKYCGQRCWNVEVNDILSTLEGCFFMSKIL